MAIMCVGCGTMIDRGDISGVFVSPATGYSKVMCPTCAASYPASSKQAAPPPQVAAGPQAGPLHRPLTMTFKSQNQMRADKGLPRLEDPVGGALPDAGAIGAAAANAQDKPQGQQVAAPSPYPPETKIASLTEKPADKPAAKPASRRGQK